MKVYVTLRNGILDPQGQAVCEALKRTGYDFVKDVKVSKVFDIKIDGNPADVHQQVEKFSKELLANPIIETFRIEDGE